MAIKNCKECGKDVSSRAKQCPHCGAPQSKSVGIGGVILALLVGYIIYAAVTGGSGSNTESSSSSKSSSSTVDLNATVRFNGTQFIIANKDSFDWTNAKLEINSKTFSSGYILNASLMKAGESYTVGALQFANSDGEKFNPFTHKALNLSIWCDTPKGKGFYYGTWQ